VIASRMFGFSQFAEAGRLMSYGASGLKMWRRTAYCVDCILKGAKHSELPMEQPTQCELVINLKTAKALGLTIPPTLLFLAEEVIRRSAMTGIPIAVRARSAFLPTVVRCVLPWYPVTAYP